MVSSCCGLINLQKACIATAIIEIVVAGIFLVLNTVTLAMEAPLAIEERRNAILVPDPYRFHAVRLVLCGLNTSYWIVSFCLAWVLLFAAKQRDLRKLRVYYVCTCIISVVFLVDIFMEVFTLTSPVITILSPAVGTVLQCYMLWIVKEFMEEVARNGCPMLIKGKGGIEDSS